MKPSSVHAYAGNLRPLHAFGPRLQGDICRFTLWCRDADTVDLLLFENNRDLRPLREVALNPDDHRFGDIWTVEVPGVSAGICYVWKINRRNSRFPENQFVLDPHAPAVAGAPAWGHSLVQRPGEPLHSGPAFPKAVVVDSHFDWGHDLAPRVPWDRMVIYEAHVRGMTAGTHHRHSGTYAGFIEKIPHLKSLGVTSVELMPMFEFDEMEYFHSNDPRSQLRNFWGYSTLSFFAPNGRFAASGNRGQQVDEFKSLVKALHAAGIEVLLDVVFNHSAEGGKNGLNYNFRVLDDEIFYIQDPVHGYHNYSGCGNTLNCNHPVVRQWILDCLRHWVSEYHIDGFRFDLAPILCRGTDGALLANPPLVEAIDEDPVLRGVKMIAEAWDAAGAYQVGSFPSPRWPEWNGKYRDDIRRFWLGEPGRLSSFATRILGSEDLYHGQTMGPLKSVNFIACHDGFTLLDLVSYTDKHNEANLENNRDGENHNFSQNCGVEGPSTDPVIRELRLRMQKNLLATLFLSRGIPMICAGDEFGRTQKGNNNAYCQDNELSWLNWTFDEDRKELLEFTRSLIRLRGELPSLRQPLFVTRGPTEHADRRVVWFGPESRPPEWNTDTAIGLRLSGRGAHFGLPEDSEDVLVFFNASAEPVRFHLPETETCKWEMRLHTTAKRVHRSHLGTSLTTQPRSLVIFSAMNRRKIP